MLKSQRDERLEVLVCLVGSLSEPQHQDSMSGDTRPKDSLRHCNKHTAERSSAGYNAAVLSDSRWRRGSRGALAVQHHGHVGGPAMPPGCGDGACPNRRWPCFAPHHVMLRRVTRQRSVIAQEHEQSSGRRTVRLAP